MKKISVGPFATNCYLLEHEDGCVLIDPGDGFRKITETLCETGKPLLGILLTHGHFDHIGAVDRLIRKYGCPVYMCEDDEKMVRNLAYNSLGPYGGVIESELQWLKGECMSIGSFDIHILYTPGHSDGSVMYIIDNVLYSGDTLFRLSVGRTDLYGGSYGKLMNSLKVIYSLSENMSVCPGHDESTTVGFEIDNNPYLR